jgi:uncharacterized protein DUF2460
MQFPTLNSGAITQYGSPIGFVWPAQVIRFVDGADQRFLACGNVLRRWGIDLRLLNESEIASIEAFFSAMSGEYSTFTFPDPISGSSVPNCRLGAPELISNYQDVDIAATSMWVVETNG